MKIAGVVGGQREMLPLTAAQHGMWFAESLSPDYSVNIAYYLSIREDEGVSLRSDLLADCVIAACREFESPYTRLVDIDGIPMQVVDPTMDMPVRRVDFRNAPDPMSAAKSWMNHDYQANVDLLVGPLASIALLRVHDDHTLLYVRGHHILLDGYSSLTSLLSALQRYNAARAGVDFSPTRHADLAALVADDEAYRSGPRRERDRQYWMEHAAGLPERVSLARHDRTVALAPQNVVAGDWLSAELQEQIERLAKDSDCSVAALLVAAFAAFMARMTGTDDVVMSLPVTGRATAAIKNAGGMLSNMLPVRARDVSQVSMGDLVRQVQNEMIGALRHQRYRFEDIRLDAGMGEGNSSSFGPIVNMMFFDKPIELSGAKVSYHILSSGILEDLRLNLYQSAPGAQLAVDLHGNPNLYDNAELESHVGRFIAFIPRLLGDFDRPIGEIDLLMPEESADLCAMGRGETTSGEDSVKTVLELVDQAIAAYPDLVALQSDDTELTYREFGERRETLMARLRADGVGAGCRVAVNLERGIGQVIAIHAVIACGAAYVPVDVELPVGRRAVIIGTVAPAVIIDDDYLASIGDQVGDSGSREIGPVHPGTGAYVIFTSGSTGTPKGVEVSHGALRNRLQWMQDHYPIGQSDGVLYKTPFTFDVSVWELIWPLTRGARMVIARPGGHRDPTYLVELIRRGGVTTLHFVPSMLELFADSGEVLPNHVATVFASGEALSPTLANAIAERSAARIVNLYGPTEAAIDVTEYVVVPGDDEIPIGKPVPNTEVLVLDNHLRQVPVGVAGELYLAGDQLAIGYITRPDLTADRFVSNPYGESGTRMYRTGDLVSRRADGNILYLGRTDFQIKIRGQRVELGEIEGVLRDSPEVEAVVALARTGPTGGPIVVAYVRLRSETETRLEELSALCRRQLPSHMVPAAIVVVDEFPVTDNGKLDRNALPEPSLTSSRAEYVAPRNAAEHALADLVSTLLGLNETPSVVENLFALGGDSLSAARLVSRARRELDMNFGLTEIFDGATLADLANQSRDDSIASGLFGDAIDGIRPAQIPLSPSQSRLWLVNRIDPDSATYNMAGTVTFESSIEVDVLRAALRDVIGRHEPLRTTFPAVNGVPAQQILPVESIGIEDLVSVREVPSDGLDRALVAEASRGFDLTTDLPIRATVFCSGDASADTLLIVLHHIAGDGASLVPLTRDLSLAYAAREQGRAAEWRPLTGHYADYAMARRAEFGDISDPSSRAYRDLEFWRGTLRGLPELLELPTDRLRPQVASGHGDYRTRVLPRDVSKSVFALADRTGSTGFLVAHAALAVVLGRMASTDDVAIGIAVHGRQGAPELDDMVGMFVNTVVLRSRLAHGLSVADFLIAGRRSFGAALDHSELPFEDVVADASPQRSLAHTPLFQVAMTWLDDPMSDSVAATARPLRLPVAKTDLEVAITVLPAEDGDDTPQIAVEFGYATDLFDASTIDLLGQSFVRVLGEMAANENRSLGSLQLESALQEVVRGAEPAQLATILERGAIAANPKSTAITYGRQSISYEVLGRITNQLARVLINRGIGPGDVVAVAISRSDKSVLATLSVIAAGAAFVLIDPLQPRARQTEMIVDSGAVLGICAEGATLAEAHGSVPWLDFEGPEISAAWTELSGARITDADRVRPVQIDDAAYLIFTSGSTGRPKATVIGHRGLANFAVNLRTNFRAGPGARVLHVSSPSFDASVLELMLAFSAGAELVVSPADVYGGEALTELIAERRITHALLTPAVLATVEPKDVPSLTTVLSGGEAIPEELAREWAGRGNGQIFNLYGPTEATVWATADGPLVPDDRVTIGLPLPGVQALVLDSALLPTPIGVPGDLYLAGDQLGLGYLGRMALTSRSFVANPFATGKRMYQTGDRVTRLHDGRLVYNGRIDFQLKIRGLRIEPGEVDAVIAAHPEVDSAVSLGVPGRDGQLVLATYVSLRRGADADADRLMQFARAKLPKYMTPQAITVLDSLPVTSVGKIDRRALPPIDLSSDVEIVAPRNATESVVAGLMAQILGLAEISVTDSFFEIGGNSLSATKLVSRLSAVLDRHVSVRDVFQAPSPAELAAAVDSLPMLNEDGSTSPIAPLTDERRAQDLPVSSAQRGMWLLNQADPDSAAYNIGLIFDIRGNLQVEALRAAVADLVVRHEALRTVYPSVDGLPVQRIMSPEEALRTVQLRVADDVENVAETVNGLASRGFTLADQPPVRLDLLPVVTKDSGGEADFVLAFVVHHIAADGASMAPLARDLMTAYAARAAGDRPTWLPLPIQYVDYAVWHANRLATTDAGGRTRQEAELEYWHERLSDAPEVLGIPADRRRPKSPTFTGGQVPVHIPASLATGIDAIARRDGSTMFMVLHAAFAILLHRITGQEQIVIGTPHAGRSEHVLDDVVGMFVNSVPLHTRVRPDDTLGELLRKVHSDDLSDMAHSDVPFEAIVGRVVGRPAASHNPIFQVMFSFQNFVIPDLELADLRIVGRDPEEVAAQVDLQLTLRPQSDSTGNLEGRFSYAVDLFDRDRVEKLAQRYLRVLEALVADDSLAVGDVDIRLDDERDIADVVDVEPVMLSLPELISRATEIAPGTAAASDSGNALTFEQIHASLTAMAAVVGDTDSALTMVLMSSLPSLAAAGAEAFAAILEQIRTNAETVLGLGLRGTDGGGLSVTGIP
ncbi:MAG: amino acid adenylation domain-containing protein [Gordonia sp. (in: high G+C Gram-positive bacteria)]|uniref:amino acid adenylation domain-containing protein n=1 Tax=Gordonia sp. (in: high G+C Gram-positive bacteria) TaxID=84139 RepID=UPI003C725BEF